MNTMKTTLLMTGLTLILIWAGNAFGGQSGMTIALVFALIMNVGSYWFSDKIVLKMYKAQEVTEAAAPELFSIVRRLAQKGRTARAAGVYNQREPAECFCNRQKS